MTSRRHFLRIAPVAGVVLLQARAAVAPGERVTEQDPQAIAVGYVEDAARADMKKYPHPAGQSCATCSIYQGQPGDDFGGCPVFGARQVASKGWCSSWTNMG